MIILNQVIIEAFSKKHANARKSLLAWRMIIIEVIWKRKQDVLRDFPKAKMLKNNRARFEIVHNTYRLIAEIDYEDQTAQVRFIGTHAEYDRIDPETI